jgi:hypothetical protein
MELGPLEEGETILNTLNRILMKWKFFQIIAA